MLTKDPPDKLVDSHAVATLIDGIADSLSWGTSFPRFFSSVRISDAFSLGKVRRCTCSDTWRLSDSPDLNGNPRTKWSFLAGKIIHNYCGLSMRRGENQWKSSKRHFIGGFSPSFPHLYANLIQFAEDFPASFDPQRAPEKSCWGSGVNGAVLPKVRLCPVGFQWPDQAGEIWWSFGLEVLDVFYRFL